MPLMLVEDVPAGRPVRSFKMVCPTIEKIESGKEELIISCGPPSKEAPERKIEVGLEDIWPRI